MINLNLSDPTYDRQKMHEQEVEEHILGLIMAHQYSMKKGIELFGEKGEEAKYFIEAQGYTVEHNILYQDNKSTILLATNGRQYMSRRTKHIRHRYFLVKNKIAMGDLEIKYAPTGEMWYDVLTKPLQGQAFNCMRAQLMNVSKKYDDKMERASTHLGLLPKVDKDAVTADRFEILEKAGVVKSGGSNVVLARSREKRDDISKAVSGRENVPSTQHRSVLGGLRIQVSDKRIAELNILVARTNGKCYRGNQDIPRESKYSLERTCKISII